MRKAKSKPQAKAPETNYTIFENGNCFELLKITKEGGKEKVFIQANTNYKEFKEASNKYRF